MRSPLPLNYLGPLPGNRKIAVVGAGISGLLLGFHLKQAGIPFRIFESSNRVGGLLQTSQLKNGIAEKAANGMLLNTAFCEMCSVLGLELLPAKKSAKKRFMLRNGKLSSQHIPFIRLPVLLFRLFQKRKQSFTSMKEFGRYLLGEEWANKLLEPGLQGIYGARLSELSFSALFPNVDRSLKNSTRFISAVREARKNYVSDVPKGIHGFKLGMQELVDALSSYLREDIELNSKWKKEEDYFPIYTIPAYSAANYFSENISAQLNRVNYLPMISSSLIYRKEDLPNFEEGFGCLIPKKENYSILGVLYNDCIFPGRVVNNEFRSLTVIARNFNGEWTLSDDEAKNKIAAEVQRLYRTDKLPIEQSICFWEKGIPLYSPDLVEAWSHLRGLLKEQNDAALFANYTGEISIRGLCGTAKQLVDSFLGK